MRTWVGQLCMKLWYVENERCLKKWCTLVIGVKTLTWELMVHDSHPYVGTGQIFTLICSVVLCLGWLYVHTDHIQDSMIVGFNLLLPLQHFREMNQSTIHNAKFIMCVSYVD